MLLLANSFDTNSEVSFRNKALLAFTYCTGMRDAAVRTITLGCIDIERMTVIQDPKKGVDVKFSKVIYSKIFPFDQELINILLQWIEYLKK